MHGDVILSSMLCTKNEYFDSCMTTRSIASFNFIIHAIMIFNFILLHAVHDSGLKKKCWLWKIRWIIIQIQIFIFLFDLTEGFISVQNRQLKALMSKILNFTFGEHFWNEKLHLDDVEKWIYHFTRLLLVLIAWIILTVIDIFGIFIDMKLEMINKLSGSFQSVNLSPWHVHEKFRFKLMTCSWD